jgi:hypothetical protein
MLLENVHEERKNSFPRGHFPEAFPDRQYSKSQLFLYHKIRWDTSTPGKCPRGKEKCGIPQGGKSAVGAKTFGGKWQGSDTIISLSQNSLGHLDSEPLLTQAPR